MFGFRVGKFLALGIVPDGHSPSLYKQFLLLLLSVVPLTQTQLALFQENVHFFSDNGIRPQTWQHNLSSTAPSFCHFQNQHSTKYQADSLPLWVVLFPIFSHHLSHSTFSELKRKHLQKIIVIKKNQTKTKNANQTRKAHVFFVCFF